MEGSNYYFKNRSHVPAFGSWDCNDDFPIPFTQCFESARQADLLQYSYSEDRDLYVAGDLYQNDIVTPTMIVVPRRKFNGTIWKKQMKASNEAVGKAGKDKWVVCDYEYEYDVKEAATPSPPPPKRAVDEDLYKISPELLYAKPKRKGIRGFFSSCLLPICAS
ncbi:uncharacterized protein [Nicotiana tomentosiformis]|uniref:Uncharacterized protein isoform X2 n=1 Tax=Nicotiana tabacum TaxID=4097 RepID=A0A1S4C0X1_TOBAC|nr:uncharacterized protein LOC104095919 isoform X2 [Nicotiana tomentosiformis]XP_016494806.1 PREDICTED: uncharacterized protein LOC107813998 isoform X2 [Nicotiana tabacum]